MFCNWRTRPISFSFLIFQIVLFCWYEKTRFFLWLRRGITSASSASIEFISSCRRPALLSIRTRATSISSVSISRTGTTSRKEKWLEGYLQYKIQFNNATSYEIWNCLTMLLDNDDIELEFGLIPALANMIDILKWHRMFQITLYSKNFNIWNKQWYIISYSTNLWDLPWSFQCLLEDPW